jgi:hypothetical protein
MQRGKIMRIEGNWHRRGTPINTDKASYQRESAFIGG